MISEQSSPAVGVGGGKRHCGHRMRVVVESEIWGILVSLFMQDGPYVVVRLVCVFYWKIKTYTNYFFTAKNVLVLFLQIYRMVAVYNEYQKSKEEERARKKRAMAKIFHFLNSPDSDKRRGNTVSPIRSVADSLRRKMDSENTDQSTASSEQTDSSLCLT